MFNTTATPDELSALAHGDLLFARLLGRYVRYLRTEPDGWLVAMDRDTLKELPDYLHPRQVEVHG